MYCICQLNVIWNDDVHLESLKDRGKIHAQTPVLLYRMLSNCDDIGHGQSEEKNAGRILIVSKTVQAKIF